MSTPILLSTGLKFLSGFRLVIGEDLNKLLDGLNSLTVPGAVTMKQMRQAIVNVSAASLYAVSDAVPADIANPINIQWMSGGVVVNGDALSVLIQATLGYTNGQMRALFVSASKLTP